MEAEILGKIVGLLEEIVGLLREIRIYLICIIGGIGGIWALLIRSKKI